MLSVKKSDITKSGAECGLSRRSFLSSSVVGAGLAAITNPGAAAAQAAGVGIGDLPDLTIAEAKIYDTDLASTGYRPLNSPDKGQLASLTTTGGIEAVYTLGNRNATPHWLEWAKARLVGKSVLDLLPTIASTSGTKASFGYDNGGRRGTFGSRAGMLGDTTAFVTAGLTGSGLTTRGGGSWPNWYTAAADVMLWDLLGQAVNRPIYKLLNGGIGGTKDRLLAYASTIHHPYIEDFAPEVVQAKAMNFRGYKIHPGPGQHRDSKITIPRYIGHIEMIKQVRAAVGDEFMLAHDPVQAYNRFEAITVGRVLDELNYAWYEDPIQTTDIEGLIELNRELDTSLNMGEFIFSISDFAEYINRDALNVVRFIADNVGGISGGMRVGLLADAFNLECQPHNWGNPIDIMLHFHLELALPNASWFELPMPPSVSDHPYMDTKFRPDAEGYIHAPTLPGMGVVINRAELDRLTKNILR
jgi:L-alanine-DL-glutamate epimerase-like enolase superfamily enzyme